MAKNTLRDAANNKIRQLEINYTATIHLNFAAWRAGLHYAGRSAPSTPVGLPRLLAPTWSLAPGVPDPGPPGPLPGTAGPRREGLM